MVQSTRQVNVHDFIQDAACRAVPYGIYDLTHRRGHVHVGTSTETPQFPWTRCATGGIALDDGGTPAPGVC